MATSHLAEWCTGTVALHARHINLNSKLHYTNLSVLLSSIQIDSWHRQNHRPGHAWFLTSFHLVVQHICRVHIFYLTSSEKTWLPIPIVACCTHSSPDIYVHRILQKWGLLSFGCEEYLCNAGIERSSIRLQSEQGIAKIEGQVLLSLLPTAWQ